MEKSFENHEMGVSRGHPGTAAGSNVMEPRMGEIRGEMMNPMPKTGMMATGIATGVAVSAITETGRGIMSTIAKHPLLVFGLGLAAGFLAHKYRKEIISTVSGAAEQGKDFVLRQKANLEDMLAESREAAEEESGGSK